MDYSEEVASNPLSQENGKGEAKGKVRFSPVNDMFAVQQVLAENPFEDSRKWVVIADRMCTTFGKKFHSRNVRERVELLRKKFVKKEREVIKKSGHEEVYSPLDVLLEEVSSLRKEHEGVSSGTPDSSNAARKEEGKLLREQAAAQLSFLETQLHEEDNGEELLNDGVVISDDELLVNEQPETPPPENVSLPPPPKKQHVVQFGSMPIQQWVESWRNTPGTSSSTGSTGSGEHATSAASPTSASVESNSGLPSAAPQTQPSLIVIHDSESPPPGASNGHNDVTAAPDVSRTASHSQARGTRLRRGSTMRSGSMSANPGTGIPPQTTPSTSSHSSTNNEVLTPSTSRKRRTGFNKSVHDYLTSKMDTEKRLQLKTLEVEEKKIASEMRKADVEEKRLQLESEKMHVEQLKSEKQFQLETERLLYEKEKFNQQQQVEQDKMNKFFQLETARFDSLMNAQLKMMEAMSNALQRK